MNARRTPGEKAFDFFNYCFLILLAVVMLFPFWLVMVNSLVGTSEYYSKSMILIPEKPTIMAYQYIFGTNWIFSGYRVTIITTVIGVLWSMFLITTAAYGLHDDVLPGRKLLHYFFLVTMWFSGGLIPYYLLITMDLKWTDNIYLLSLIDGLLVWSYLIMRNHFKGLPAELRESAILDGAGEWRSLWSIIIPLSLPVIATLTLFAAVVRWNSWTWALYFVNDEQKIPLPIILRRMVVDERQTVDGATQQLRDAWARRYSGTDRPALLDVAVKNAVIVVTALPIICLYPWFQKYFVKGVLVGSVKG